MALTNWNDILNKPKGIDQIEEIALEVSELSSSVLTIAGDVQDLELSVADLSASVLTIGEKVDYLENEFITFTFDITIASTAEGATNLHTIPNVPANYTVISFTPIYTSDLFFYNGAKDHLSFSLGGDPNTFRVSISVGNVGDTVDRTLTFRAIAQKNTVQTTTRVTKKKTTKKK